MASSSAAPVAGPSGVSTATATPAAPAAGARTWYDGTPERVRYCDKYCVLLPDPLGGSPARNPTAEQYPWAAIPRLVPLTLGENGPPDAPCVNATAPVVTRFHPNALDADAAMHCLASTLIANVEGHNRGIPAAGLPYVAAMMGLDESIMQWVASEPTPANRLDGPITRAYSVLNTACTTRAARRLPLVVFHEPRFGRGFGIRGVAQPDARVRGLLPGTPIQTGEKHVSTELDVNNVDVMGDPSARLPRAARLYDRLPRRVFVLGFERPRPLVDPKDRGHRKYPVVCRACRSTDPRGPRCRPSWGHARSADGDELYAVLQHVKSGQLGESIDEPAAPQRHAYVWLDNAADASKRLSDALLQIWGLPATKQLRAVLAMYEQEDEPLLSGAAPFPAPPEASGLGDTVAAITPFHYRLRAELLQNWNGDRPGEACGIVLCLGHHGSGSREPACPKRSATPSPSRKQSETKRERSATAAGAARAARPPLPASARVAPAGVVELPCPDAHAAAGRHRPAPRAPRILQGSRVTRADAVIDGADRKSSAAPTSRSEGLHARSSKQRAALHFQAPELTNSWATAPTAHDSRSRSPGWRADGRLNAPVPIAKVIDGINGLPHDFRRLLLQCPGFVYALHADGTLGESTRVKFIFDTGAMEMLARKSTCRPARATRV
eukprot:tig00021612_g22850.t1